MPGVEFSDFVREHQGSLYRTAFALTGSASAAEDLLQESLTGLYPRWGNVVAARSPVAYVRRSITNTFISQTRRRRPETVSVDGSPHGWAGATYARAGGIGADPADAVVDQGFALDLLEILPERQRAAIVLRYLYDLPDTEIADAIEAAPATVRSLISRGMSALRERAGDNDLIGDRT